MISQLRMKNFKSWQDTGDVRLGRISGFFGPNSSGKTSILQMLLALKLTTESSDRNLPLVTNSGRDGEGALNLGSVRDVLYSGASELTLALTWRLPESNNKRSKRNGRQLGKQQTEAALRPLDALEGLSFETRIAVDEPTTSPPRVTSMTYSGEGLSAAMVNVNGSYITEISWQGMKPQLQQGRPRTKMPAPIKSYGFPAEAIRQYQNADYLNDLVLSLEQLMGRTYYLGPLRQYPQRHYAWSGERPSDLGAKGELAVAALLAGG